MNYILILKIVVYWLLIFGIVYFLAKSEFKKSNNKWKVYCELTMLGTLFSIMKMITIWILPIIAFVYFTYWFFNL